MKISNFNKAPLPFQGQKRHFIRDTIDVLKDWQSHGVINNDTVILDVFGGSGLISHNVKRQFPENLVIWNDYDNYQQRLEHVENTRLLHEKITGILHDLNIAREKRISGSGRDMILQQVIQHEQQHLWADFITISSWILFSCNYTQSYDMLKKNTFYNNVPNIISETTGYLHGVQRESMDFTQLIEKYTSDSTVLILDPPYLQTDKAAYNLKNTWNISTFLKLMDNLTPPWILYGCERCDILPFFEYMSDKKPVFKNYGIRQRPMSGWNPASGTRRPEYMLYSVAAC